MTTHPETAARSLVMFAKFPEAGKVKTRLALGAGDAHGRGLTDVTRRRDAAALGDDRALEHCRELYAAFLQDRIAVHQRGDYRFLLGVSDPGEPARFAELVGHPVDTLLLQGATMGEMLRSAFQQLLPGRVLITASDYPVLPNYIVDDAFAALEEADVALVPAHDGAYNLIGMRCFHDIFDLEAWSSGRELADTEALLIERGISRVLLRQHVIRDVDTLADFEQVMQSLDATAAPHTAAQVAVWREELALAV